VACTAAIVGALAGFGNILEEPSFVTREPFVAAWVSIIVGIAMDN